MDSQREETIVKQQVLNTIKAPEERSHLINYLVMNRQALDQLYPIVLPKPNPGFEQRYYDLLDTGWYELDSETSDATELIKKSTLPVSVDEILKVGIDAVATEWAEDIYFNLLSEKKCVQEDEYWEIVKRLPDFYAIEGGKQKMKDYLMNINLSTFLDLLQGMPVFNLNLPNPALPNYNLKGKGYHPENAFDWINFDKTALLKCSTALSEPTKSILSEKYLKPAAGTLLLETIKRDIDQLKLKQAGNEPNGHLIIKYDIANRNFLHTSLVIHVLEDFYQWIEFWTSSDFPIGLNVAFLIGG